MRADLTFEAATLRAALSRSPDILRFIEQKAPRAIRDWNELGGEEYARAFTVAGTAGHDVIHDIYGALIDTLQRGGTQDDFADLVTPILRQKGWLSDRPGQLGHRVALIYDTNLRVARSIGRWQRVQDNAAVMPYLRGVTAGDGRVRDEHTAFQGIVLPVTHWFWTEFWPPLYFRCRCDVIQMTRSQFRRRGLVITPEAEVLARAAQIRPQSWGFNPALVPNQKLNEKVTQTNANGLPGERPVDYALQQQRGRSAWAAIMGLALQQLIMGLARAIEDA